MRVPSLKLFSSGIALCAIVGFVGSGAVASVTYPEKDVSGWAVYGWDNDCWMKAEFTDGTEFAYSWDPKNDDSYIQLTNDKWKSIVKGEKYTLKFELDDWVFDESASGIKEDGFSPGIVFFVDEKDEFIAKLALSSAARFYVDDKFLGGFNLRGSRAASLELARCAYTLRSKVVDDPFEK